MYAAYEDAVLERLHKAEMTMLKDFIAICEKYDINYFAIAGTAIGAVRHQGFIPWDDDIDIAMLREDYEKFVKYAPQEFGDKYRMMGPDMPNKYYNLQPAMERIGTKFINDGAWASKLQPGIFLDLFIYDNIPEDEKEAAIIIKKCRFYKILYIMRNINYFKILKNFPFKQRIRLAISGVLHIFLKLIPKGDKLIYNKYMSYATKYYGKSETYTALSDPGSDIMWVKTDEMFPLVDMPFEDITIKMLNKYDDQLKRHMGEYMTIPPVEKRTNHSPLVLDFGEDF